MPGETQGRFAPRASVSSEALNRIASTVESSSQVVTPGLYRDSGGVSRIDFGDMFLVEITGFKSSNTTQEGEPKLYSWRAVEYDQDNALADTDPPLEGTVGVTDKTPGVQFGEYTYDRPAIGCLALLRKGYYDKYDIVMWTANRDVMVFKASDATYGTRSCTGTPQVYATGTGWIDAPWASVAHWELVTEIGYSYPVTDRYYIGRRIEQRRDPDEHDDEPIYKYIIWPGGLSISSSSYEVSGSPTNLPHTPATYGVSDLIFSEDFYWVTLSGSPPADRKKIGIYVADRHQPGIIAANYLGAEGSPGYTPRFPNNTTTGYQWLGEDTKCFGAVYAENTVVVGSYLYGTPDPPTGHAAWQSYSPSTGVPGVLAAGIMSLSGSATGFSGHQYRGRISSGSLDLAVTGTAVGGSTMRIGYISNPGVYTQGGSSAIVTSGSVSFTDMGLFMSGGPGFFVGSCQVDIGQYSGSGSTTWAMGADGMPTRGTTFGTGTYEGFHLNKNTNSGFHGHITVAASYSSGYTAILKIGNYSSGFASANNLGKLQISRSGQIYCDHNTGLVESGGGAGVTNGALGFSFVNGWCTAVPSTPAAGAIMVSNGSGIVASTLVRELSGQFQPGAGSGRWVAFSSASI